MKKINFYKAFGVFVFIISVFCLGEVDYNIILNRNIFTKPYIEKKDEKKNIKKESILKPPPTPSLDSLIEVKGTILIGNNCYGIIGIKGKNTNVIVKKNEKILGAEVVEIKENYIVFLYNGKEEKINIEKDYNQGNFVKAIPGVEVKVEENIRKNQELSLLKELQFKEPVIVDFEKTIDELKNDKELLKNINISPDINEGQVNGFKINGLSENSIPYQYGLRNGDIIRRVNGTVIDSIAKGYAVYNQIVQSGTNIVTVEVLRNGEPIVLSYKLK